MINPNTLKPFGKFCVTLGMIPSSYKASLTYEEQLLWFCNYLETKVIPAINNNAEALEEVQALYEEIRQFIVDYFAHLDVQEEIDNKLDEMAESGTLADIINQEIFDDLNAQIQENAQDIAEIQRRKFLLVGDSFLQGYSPDGNVMSWGEFFLNTSNYTGKRIYRGGASFSNYNNSFYSLINEETTTDYTDVIIMGGYNDKDGSFDSIVSGISDTITLIKSKFPSLKNIYIGMCASSTLFDDINKLASVLYAYIHGAKINNCKYLNGVEFSLLLKSYFSSDGVHPTQVGQYAIALNLLNAFYTGYANAIIG